MATVKIRTQLQANVKRQEANLIRIKKCTRGVVVRVFKFNSQ